jgi:uncharacterized protein
MRTMPQVLFFLLFFTLISAPISFYIFLRGLQSFPQDSNLRNAFILLFWFVALSFVGGRLLEKVFPSAISDLLLWTGSFWIGAMIYFLIILATFDLLRLINHFVPFFPSFITSNYPIAKYVTAIIVTIFIGTLLLVGHINSLIPRIVSLDLPIEKKAGSLKTLNIVVVSDVHLGILVGRSRIDQIVERMNRLDPDLVLLPGDIVDEDLAPVIKQNLGEALKSIKSRFGVYAITGNHEYIGGVEQACNYLTEHNITVLRDRSVKIGDAFFLVGREDRSKNRGGGQRRQLPALMSEVDKNYPVILMDHQPFELNEAMEQAVDLQISGHTHNGQLWPINYIVGAIYELPWGYKKSANTHFYVSDGIGTWGPPVRIGNRPEIVNIRLHFE